MPPDFPPRCASSATRTGSSTSTTRCSPASAAPARSGRSSTTGVEPDLLVAGKSLGGGLPLAAVTGRAELMDAPPPGGLGGTFGGNPVACAAALAVPRRVASPSSARARTSSAQRIRARLEAIAARAPASARCAGSARCSRSSSSPSRQGRLRRAATAVARRARARPDPAHLRALRQRDPALVPLVDRRRRARPGPRHPGGVACRRRRRRCLRPAPISTSRSSACARPTATSWRSTASTSRSRAASSSRCSARPAPARRRRCALIAGFERPDAGHVELARRRHRRAAALRARRQHRLPGLRAVPAHDRRRERRATACA